MIERSAVRTSSAVNGVSIALTSTNSTASQILSRIFPATSNPGTGANFKRSTQVKRVSWPMLAAIPRAPPMASIASYRAWVSVGLTERNGHTERVWAYPSACSMGFIRLRLKLFHQVNEGAIAPPPSEFWPPTRAGNVGGCDGARTANLIWVGVLVAGAAGGRRALVPVVNCGAARPMEMMGLVAFVAGFRTGVLVRTLCLIFRTFARAIRASCVDSSSVLSASSRSAIPANFLRNFSTRSSVTIPRQKSGTHSLIPALAPSSQSQRF
jgi:hypothetical protein